MKKLFVLLLFLTTITILAQSEGETNTQNTQEVPRIFIKLGDITGEDIVLQGMNSTQSFWVVLPPNWEITEDVVIRLQYHASELLKEDTSSVTVIVNDTVIRSFVPENDGLMHTIELAFPSDLIGENSGFTIELNGYLRVTYDECELASLPSQWFSVSRETTIGVLPNADLIAPSLNNVAENLINSSPYILSQGLVFILPTNPTVEELNVIMAVAMRIGQSNSVDLPTITVRTPETVTPEELANSSIIAIGLLEDNSYLQQIISNTEIYDGNSFISADGIMIPDGDGVIAIINSPWNDNHMALALSANDATGLLSLNRAFTYNNFYNQLDGPYRFVAADPSDIPLGQEALWIDNEATMAETGFESRMVYGLGSSSVFHSFRRPSGWQLQDGAQLEIHLGTSVLDQGSHLAVFLDNIFIGTIETEDVFDITKLLPLSINQINTQWLTNPYPLSTLRFDVVNILPFNQCLRMGPLDIWTRIESNSILRMPHEVLDFPNIRVFPYPFVSGDNPTTLTFALPPEPTFEDIQDGMLLSLTIGRYKLSNVDLHVSLSPTITEEMQSGHLIVLGQPQNQPLIAAVTPDYLVIPQETIYAVIGTSTTGIIQEFVAPWDDNLVVMIIHGDEPENIRAGVQSLVNYDLIVDLIASETKEYRLIRSSPADE